MYDLLLYSLIFGFFGYALGVIFAQKSILKISSLLNNPMTSVREFFESGGDRVFLFFIILIPLGTYYLLERSLDLDSLIQLLIVEVTFFAVVYSTIIKNNAAEYRSRPIIKVSFSNLGSKFYHMTTLYESITLRNNMIVVAAIPTYYVSVEVINDGKTMLKDVEVVLQRVESNKPLARPFLPLNLGWAFMGDTASVAIPPHGMSKLINIMEAREPQAEGRLIASLTNEGGVWDESRYTALSDGFRACSTAKPNTLSDIFPPGTYTFHLVVTASNAVPKYIKLSVHYDGAWCRTTSMEDMTSTHLRVKLQG